MIFLVVELGHIQNFLIGRSPRNETGSDLFNSQPNQLQTAPERGGHLWERVRELCLRPGGYFYNGIAGTFRTASSEKRNMPK